MSAQTPTSTSPVQGQESAHLPENIMRKLASAYGDRDSTLTARAVAVAAAIAFGSDVKSIARDMADANRADHTIPVVAAATLGYARFASTVAEMTGATLTTWAKRDSAAVANVVRAAKRAGVKNATAAVREALHGIDGAVAREDVANEVMTRLLSGILPAPTAQGPRSAAGEANNPAGDDADDAAPARITPAGFSDADALAAIRAVTHHLQSGGTFSADLASALASLTDAASAARRRTATAPRVAPVAAPVAA